MKNKIPYFTQYCNLVIENYWKGLNIDSASEEQIAKIQELQSKAVIESGLTLNELTLILICRKYRIFNKVNVLARKLIK